MFERVSISHKVVGRSTVVLYLIFFVFALGYISTLQYRPYPFYHLVKIIPVICLSIIAFLNITGAKRKFIFVGLLFSAVGDFFLSLKGREYFIYGLIAFGFAQIMYILAFLRKPELKKTRSYFSLLFILYALIIGIFLFPKLGGRLVPISVYFSLLITMGISSVLGKDNHFLVIPGAFLFLVSDSIIAINMFITMVPQSSLLIMSTYFAAQFLITYGSIEKRRANG